MEIAPISDGTPTDCGLPSLMTWLRRSRELSTKRPAAFPSPLQSGQKKYVWQYPSWPRLRWDAKPLFDLLAHARREQSLLLARAREMGLSAQCGFFVDEAFTTAAIEGEKLDRASIRSSVARRLGLDTAGLPEPQRHTDGLVEMLFDATLKFREPLTAKRLQGWQAALFPTGFSGMGQIAVGRWRSGTEPMRVVSGALGREKVHFTAPPSKAVPGEMKAFLQWWRHPPRGLDGLIRAGMAHFWLVTIHPFEDGNGRVARALTDMALAQDEGTGMRLYSLSAQILKERKQYYGTLESCQKSNGDITEWLALFLGMYARALVASQVQVDRSLAASRFWLAPRTHGLNERQRKVLQRMLDTGPEGLANCMTNRIYVSLTRVSRESAKRDLAELEHLGILKRNPGAGRSVSYALRLDAADVT